MSYSVYVHIPFCASKCNYCSFYSAHADENTKEKYVDALVNEIEFTETADKKIDSVFFGGGTPSVLSPALFLKIINALKNKFDLSEAEITTELNPDSVDNILSPDILPFFTRLSMGVQSFDDETLKILGRRHDVKTVVEAFEKLRTAGKDNINIDLMLALPNDGDLKILEKSLKNAAELSPEHISAYILTPEKGTAIYKKYGMPSDELSEKAYLKTCGFLEESGYEHYEISNFAKPNRRCRHNMCYWEQKKYYAFGSQACGFDGKNRYKIDCTTKDFIENNGIIEPTIEETLDENDLENEKIMLSLRLKDGINGEILNKIKNKPTKMQLIERLIKTGLAIKNGNGFRLTDRGFLVSNEIIRELTD